MLRAALLVGAFVAGLVPAGAQERGVERAAVVRPTATVPPDAFPVASDARLGGDNTRTRLVMDLTRPDRGCGVHAG